MRTCKEKLALLPFILCFSICQGQGKADSVHKLREVTVQAHRPLSTSYLNDVHEGIIYAGKKTQLILTDSLVGSKAQNNPRQMLGTVPGINFSETQSGGFPSNGIAFRGLNPQQSVELDLRQNGYNIAGDIYGYPESYYQPPLEAVERIEITRGASSLQFGPQFGGVINYLIHRPSPKPFEYSTGQTAGSFGFFSSYHAVSGTRERWSWFTYGQFQSQQGRRPNSDLRQVSAFARLDYQAGARLKLGLEYSLLRNRIHMAGGLSDEEYALNARSSYRSRNWLSTPWNILAFTATYPVSDRLQFNLRSALNFSARNIIWRNEDGGPQGVDTLGASGYATREAEHESFLSSTTELRMLATYRLGGRTHNLAAGVRVFSGHMNRQEDGPGSAGSDFDFKLYGGDYGKSLVFNTFNIAPFFENTFWLSSRFSITPGFRFEYLRSSASGFVTPDSGAVIQIKETRPRYIALAGLGMQFKLGKSQNLYANISQAYRPIEYSYQYPLGTGNNTRIDPRLKDITGFNADAGWRGAFSDYVHFDLGLFYLRKNGEVGNEVLQEAGKEVIYTTNISDAVHKGLETYLEVNLSSLFGLNAGIGKISAFNSFAFDKAIFLRGSYAGNTVPFAPRSIERAGLTYRKGILSLSWQTSNTSSSFSDAANQVKGSDAETGLLPAYRVMDASFGLKFKSFQIKGGINNLGDARYFTLRTSEYPGPGIIPSAGRNFYLGFEATF